MSGSEIQAKLGLPDTPSFYAPVNSIPAGTTIQGGIAGPAFGQPGGGMQYFVDATNLEFGSAAGLPCC
ncbi:MAG: hypothetical protein GIW97_07295 [Candidatus Eremiobacteraeota bacterium]|nr:hypothetical protein [Candidatus Eremiobacteraeota bacterium]